MISVMLTISRMAQSSIKTLDLRIICFNRLYILQYKFCTALHFFLTFKDNTFHKVHINCIDIMQSSPQRWHAYNISCLPPTAK